MADTKLLLQRQQNTIQARRTELGTPLQSKLSSDEQAELHTTNEELVKLKEQAFAKSQARSDAELLRNTLAQELSENFNKRKAEINTELASVAVSDEVLTLQQREADLATITEALNNNKTTIDSTYPRPKHYMKTLTYLASRTRRFHQTEDRRSKCHKETYRNNKGNPLSFYSSLPLLPLAFP